MSGVGSASAAGARSEAQPSGVRRASASAAGARSEAQPGGVSGTSAKLFVYGTLRRGAPMHALLDGRVRLDGPARAPGRLVDLGDYPALVEPAGPDDRVVGELYTVADAERDALLASLDRYEGPHFRRERVFVEGPLGPVRAWLYRYQRDWSGRPFIPGGDFLGRASPDYSRKSSPRHGR